MNKTTGAWNWQFTQARIVLGYASPLTYLFTTWCCKPRNSAYALFARCAQIWTWTDSVSQSLRKFQLEKTRRILTGLIMTITLLQTITKHVLPNFLQSMIKIWRTSELVRWVWHQRHLIYGFQNMCATRNKDKALNLKALRPLWASGKQWSTWTQDQN
jgi:hypothetical protein